jgi:hypothetical protein
LGAKKLVLKFRSVKSIVIAAARTGNERRSKKAVTKIDQTKSGMVYISIPRQRIFRIVTIKLIAPMIDEAPER